MRLTKIYTRSGDAGSTGLADGSRLPKDSLRVDAMGDLDELNSTLGIVLTHCDQPAVVRCLETVQHRLFDLGGELALPGRAVISAEQVTALERDLDRWNADLPPLREFLLPGGPAAAAHCHHARSVCRRAERALVRLSRAEPVNSESLKYLNRLSDLLFVAARVLATADGRNETTWQRIE